jgi:hypothetical protein
MKQYIIIFIDSYMGGEAEPEYKMIELEDDEYDTMKNMVKDFEHTRLPYFYPQMYLYPLEHNTLEDVKEWITLLKNKVIEWQKELEERGEGIRKRRDHQFQSK